jgi:hypothetical protein
VQLHVIPFSRYRSCGRIPSYRLGREYYAHHGKPLAFLPTELGSRPGRDFSTWRNENRQKSRGSGRTAQPGRLFAHRVKSLEIEVIKPVLLALLDYKSDLLPSDQIEASLDVLESGRREDGTVEQALFTLAHRP